MHLHLEINFVFKTTFAQLYSPEDFLTNMKLRVVSY